MANQNSMEKFPEVLSSKSYIKRINLQDVQLTEVIEARKKAGKSEPERGKKHRTRNRHRWTKKARENDLEGTRQNNSVT